MKKTDRINGSSVRTPGDNRRNFAQVPAMTKPIPVPRQKELKPLKEKKD